ncbi:MAG: M23 family metallopeptidase [Microbacterium sp.]
MAAREAARTAAEPIVTSDTLVAPVVATAPIALPAAAQRGEPSAAASAEPVADAVFAQAVHADASVVVDEFEAAARLFSFTGETPIQVAAAAIAEEEPDQAEQTGATPWRRLFRGRGGSLKRLTAAGASIGAMSVVGLLTVGMTTPAEAVSAASGTVSVSLSSSVSSISASDVQAYVAPASAQTAALDDRADYSTESVAAIAAANDITYYSDFYTNNPNAAIQWPFAVGVSISYGFGWRGSEFHEGADFTPGEGAHIQAIAAGTVRISTDSGGAYGVTIVIDHIIDGQLVSSRYAHMLYGSRQVEVGDTVVAGEFIGETGDTGQSYGAHTHVEILQNGTTAIDPIAWLRANAGRMDLGD